MATVYDGFGLQMYSLFSIDHTTRYTQYSKLLQCNVTLVTSTLRPPQNAVILPPLLQTPSYFGNGLLHSEYEGIEYTSKSLRRIFD